jgi:hypothetical protein
VGAGELAIIFKVVRRFLMADVIDLAYQIIALHEENKYLREELERANEYEKMFSDSLEKRKDEHNKFVSLMLDATLDPESLINKGNAALVEIAASKQE